MADFQRVVEEIRSFLQGSDQTLRDPIPEYAGSYAEAVREANDRLRRCKEFLNQNLRSEAIQVAESAPNLVDMVAVLDFPELGEWEEFCADHALTPPPKLQLLVAEDLNEAYAAEEPLREHLKQLRFLALTRAPLAQRIKVMRELAVLDPESHFWKDDLVVFEAARLKEFEQEARDAAARGDAQRLKELALELKSDQWVRPPSAELVDKVKKAYSKISRSVGRERVESLAPQLIESATSGDIDRARRLRDEWGQAVKEARLTPDDILSQQAAPALDWIAEHDRHAEAEAAFHATVSNLINELNAGRKASVPKLERLRQESLAFGRPLPIEVEERYTSVVGSIQAAAAWNRKLFLIGTLGGAAVVVLLIGFLVMLSMRGNTTQVIAGKITALLDENDVDGAERELNLLREEDPTLLQNAAISPLADRLNKMKADDADRVSTFELHLKNAQAFIDRDILDGRGAGIEAGGAVRAADT
ncbi:MAG: hypothetical protein R3B90_09795 [Planctomycetaceae bacterium]